MSNVFRHPNLQTRFLFRVLLPPFFLLLIVSVVAYGVLSIGIRDSKADSLRRAATATADKLESEIQLRKRVLLGIGETIFTIKDERREYRDTLDANYKKCHAQVAGGKSFTAAPDKACASFYSGFAPALQGDTSLTEALNHEYKALAAANTDNENASMQEQLKIYNSFFDEASWLMVVDTSGEVIQQAVDQEASPDGREQYVDVLKDVAKGALTQQVEGKYALFGDSRQLLFAYPIHDKGSIIASYDMDNRNFLYPVWESVPIDTRESYAMIADTESEQAYPKIDKNKQLYLSVIKADDERQTEFTSDGIDYFATSVPIEGTSWRTIISSPSAYALAPLANAQIIAIFVIGGLLVIFLWAGSRFIRRTVDSILGLVGGALVFANNHLDHRIDTSRMSDKEFSQLADVMNTMAGKIQEAEKAIDQKNKEFISVATHEIKAPITAIIGNLSMMLDDGMGSIDDVARNLSTQAYKGTVRLRDLVNELLDIARLESGSIQFDLTDVDLASEIKDMIDVQHAFAVEKGIDIRYAPPTTPVAVRADKTKLEIILTNFISNGIKYNRSNGTVTISHQLLDGYVQITVQDTGLGIPQDQQAKMFQKFFRVEGSDRTKIPGTGLGMYITKQFIEGMGGKLWFESEHGKGTTFNFTIPLATPIRQSDNSEIPQQLHPRVAQSDAVQDSNEARDESYT